LPLAALCSPIYIFVFPRYNPRPDQTTGKKLAEVDWVGAVLNGAVLVLFLIAVTFAGSTFAWNSGSNIALWVVFAVTLIAYITQQAFAIFTTRERQIFPVHFLKSRTMVLLYISTGAAAAANAVTLYYIPLFFQFTKGDSALQAAVRLLPFIVILIVFVMLAGGSLPVVGRYSIYYVLGGAIILTGGALMFTVKENTNVGRIYGFEILIAAGCGLVFQNGYAVAAAKVSMKDKSNAIGFMNVSQIGSIAIALAIAGCLFQNLGFKDLKSTLAVYDFPDGYVQSALAGTISPIFASGNTEVIDLVIASVSKTLIKIFGMVIAAGALTFISGLLMRHEKIDLEMTAGG
jgi:hypothetical protein